MTYQNEKLQVQRTVMLVVKLHESVLTEEFLDEFEHGMFALNSRPTRQQALFVYVAELMSGDASASFVEGVGKVNHWEHEDPTAELPIVAVHLDSDYETEILP